MHTLAKGLITRRAFDGKARIVGGKSAGVVEAFLSYVPMGSEKCSGKENFLRCKFI